MKTNNLNLLSISIGLVYLWFGILKFFPELSPAEGLAKNTIDSLTFGMIPENISIVLLALWETLIGVFLIFGWFRRGTVILAVVHMVLTFSPLLLFPEETFNQGPFYLTLLGQYIMKNLIIIAALVLIYSEESKSSKTHSRENKRFLDFFGMKFSVQKSLLRIWTSAAKSAQ